MSEPDDAEERYAELEFRDAVHEWLDCRDALRVYRGLAKRGYELKNKIAESESRLRLAQERIHESMAKFKDVFPPEVSS